jgi:hypothetical protein
MGVNFMPQTYTFQACPSIAFGSMPSGRKPFSVSGGTEPEVFARMAGNQIGVRKNAF